MIMVILTLAVISILAIITCILLSMFKPGGRIFYLTFSCGWGGGLIYYLLFLLCPKCFTSDILLSMILYQYIIFSAWFLHEAFKRLVALLRNKKAKSMRRGDK